MEWVARLSEQELQIIIDNIKDGSLRHPFAEIGLSRIFGPETGRTAHIGLSDLAAKNFNPEQIVDVLKLIQKDRIKRSTIHALDHLDLVWTGPETNGVTNRDTKVVVQELFRNAKQSVLIAGFAVYQGKEVFKSLADAMEKNQDLTVDMYLNIHRKYGDTTCPDDLVKRFTDDFKRRQWSGSRLPNVYYDPRSISLDPNTKAVLHAKCIVVDKEISFVTSANFTEAAQERNIEAGILVRLPSFSEKLYMHFAALSSTGILKKVF